MDKSLLSAKFKKDYIAYLAIAIFFFILTSELVIAVWLPVHLRSENVWALQVARQDMIDMFDSLRSGFGRISKTSQLEGEANIVSKCLDSLAIYLRTYQAGLNAGQIAEIRSNLDDFQAILDRLKKDKPYGHQQKIDSSDFLKRLLAEGMKPVSPPESDK
ncbi:MAG: hypothetical protein WCV67_07785 [Victivallaceae bacterium]